MLEKHSFLYAELNPVKECMNEWMSHYQIINKMITAKVADESFVNVTNFIYPVKTARSQNFVYWEQIKFGECLLPCSFELVFYSERAYSLG